MSLNRNGYFRFVGYAAALLFSGLVWWGLIVLARTLSGQHDDDARNREAHRREAHAPAVAVPAGTGPGVETGAMSPLSTAQ